MSVQSVIEQEELGVCPLCQEQKGVRFADWHRRYLNRGAPKTRFQGKASMSFHLWNTHKIEISQSQIAALHQKDKLSLELARMVLAKESAWGI